MGGRQARGPPPGDPVGCHNEQEGSRLRKGKARGGEDVKARSAVCANILLLSLSSVLPGPYSGGGPPSHSRLQRGFREGNLMERKG